MMLKSKLAPLAGAPQPFDQILHQAGQVIFGKGTEIRLAVACLLANGHLLIEDLPGMGKTTLAHTLARLLGLQFSRIQFTSDLLPADITGVSIFERDKSAFRFLPGPVFAQLVLADEINRATPKTQSALLEAMEEGQVTAEGQTHTLPRPFFVIATQNPAHQIGTFPLPESQLDRFLMRIELGYPDRAAERTLLATGGSAARPTPCPACSRRQTCPPSRAGLPPSIPLHRSSTMYRRCSKPPATTRPSSTACRHAPASPCSRQPAPGPGWTAATWSFRTTCKRYCQPSPAIACAPPSRAAMHKPKTSPACCAALPFPEP